MKRAGDHWGPIGIAVGAVALVLAWEYGVGPAGIPEYLLPRPSIIFQKWWQTLAVQLEHLTVTGATTLAGLLLSLVAGLLLALLTIYVRPLKAVVLPAFAAFNGIPKLAIAPLFVTWFGLGAEPKVLLAFLMGLFPIRERGDAREIEPDARPGPPGRGDRGRSLQLRLPGFILTSPARSRWRSSGAAPDRG
jgi:ABC-type nitrate/sulfonate/bicarbonate transport system permease component